MAYNTYKTVSLLFITAMVSIGAEKSSSSSSPGSSGEVNGVTITSCRSGERHSSSSEDKESNGQCISAYVMKESGNITLSGTNIGDPKDFLLSLEIKSLQEISTTGENIKSTGHSYTTFSNQRFRISATQDGQYRGIRVNWLVLESTLDNSASIKVYLYLMKEHGLVTNGDETFEVWPGTAKINVQIFDWPFCGHHGVTCKDCVTYEIGKYLDMTIAVKGKHAAVTKNNGVSDGETFDVGSGYIVFSRKMQIDGSDKFKDLISGYPKLKRLGEKDIFRLRFPVFKSKVLYDPHFIGFD